MLCWLAMISDTVLAAYDTQIRQSTRAPDPGTRIEADGTIVRWVAPEGRVTSSVTWSRLDPATAEAVIAAQVAFFRARGQAFEWKLFDYDQPGDLAQRLLAAGFVPEDTEVVMVADAATAATEVPLPEGLTVREVTGEAGLDLLFDLHERVFGEDRIRESLRDVVRAVAQSIGMVIAFAGQEPVSAARVEFVPGADFAGLWGGGTLPEWRGRGLYRALVARRAQMALARGYRYVQVDALPTSQPILDRLGFARLASTTPYIWDPEAATDTLPTSGKCQNSRRPAGPG
jgi:GNAT superfamily N-acetyltransferase